MIEVETFLTHDTIFSISISNRNSRSPINLINTGVNRIVITAGSFQVDSDVDVDAFDYITEGVNGVIDFDLTDLDIPVGSHLCRLTIYDVNHPNGQPVPDKFKLTVHPKQIREEII